MFSKAMVIQKEVFYCSKKMHMNIHTYMYYDNPIHRQLAFHISPLISQFARHCKHFTYKPPKDLLLLSL